MNQRKETKNYYNKVAELVFNKWFENPALLPTLTTFVSHLPTNPLVLDLGCGTGGESKRLSKLGAQVIGVDFSEESLGYAKRNVPEAEFILMDILDMDFPKEHFDGILEAGVLFHFTKEEQDFVLNKIISSIKPKGAFLSYYPEGDFEGLQDSEASGEMLKIYARRLPINVWINQVMDKGFIEYIKHEFNLEPFKCIEFFK